MTQTIHLHGPLREARLLSEEERLKASYNRGLCDAENAIREQLLTQRAELNQLQHCILISLREAVSHVIRDTQKEVTSLALEAAQKLVANLPISVELVEAVIREALDQMEQSAECFISLHPDDYALLQKINSPFLVSQPTGEKLHFKTSPEVNRGGCLVQTRFGTIDARRESKMEQLKKTLPPL